MDTATLPQLTDEQRANVVEWIDALESNDYPQGSLLLCRLQGGKWEYCCLGVACSLKEIPFQVITHTLAVEARDFNFNGSAAGYSALPDETWFEDTYGFNLERLFTFRWTNATDGETHMEQCSLPNANDNLVPFAEIAQVLRREILGQNI